MKKFPLFAILFFAISAARADLIVYTVKNSASVTTSNAVAKVSELGWIIFDTDTAEIGEVVYFPSLGTFTSDFPSDVQFNYLNNSKVTLLTIIPDSGRGFVSAKGTTSSINSGLSLWQLPKSFTISGSDFVNGSYSELKGSGVFDSKDSSIINLDGDTLDDAVNYFSNILNQKGYTAF
jgi:hypothetical protein